MMSHDQVLIARICLVAFDFLSDLPVLLTSFRFSSRRAWMSCNPHDRLGLRLKRAESGFSATFFMSPRDLAAFG
jgi:hypothetical protein